MTDEQHQEPYEPVPAERDMLTPKEVGERVGLSHHAIYRAIARGDLEAFEIVPGHLRIDRAEYERWRFSTRPPNGDPAGPRPRRRSSRRRGGGGFASELKAIEEDAA